MKVTREQIILKALDYFAVHDYERTSIDSIAADLGITKGSIYYHFKNKEDLLRGGLDYVLDGLGRFVNDMLQPELSIREILEPMFCLESAGKLYSRVLQVEFLSDYRVMMYLLFLALHKFPDQEAKIREIYRKSLNIFKMLLDAGVGRGELKSGLDTGAVAFELVAFLEGGMLLSSLAVSEDGDRDGRQVFEVIWDRIKV